MNNEHRYVKVSKYASSWHIRREPGDRALCGLRAKLHGWTKTRRTRPSFSSLCMRCEQIEKAHKKPGSQPRSTKRLWQGEGKYKVNEHGYIEVSFRHSETLPGFRTRLPWRYDRLDAPLVRVTVELIEPKQDNG